MFKKRVTKVIPVMLLFRLMACWERPISSLEEMAPDIWRVADLLVPGFTDS